MEIRINLHRISQAEMDTLCAYAEPKEVECEPQESARVIRFPGRSRLS
jgi:hypothetical protein